MTILDRFEDTAMVKIVAAEWETFNHRSVAFYERLGFAAVARFNEPTTGADYVVMVRHPATH